MKVGKNPSVNGIRSLEDWWHIFSKAGKIWSIRLVSNDDDSVLGMNHDADRFETDVSACWSNRET